jgi:hypothetical protein
MKLGELGPIPILALSCGRAKAETIFGFFQAKEHVILSKAILL